MNRATLGMGFEPANTGVTVQCLNHLATPMFKGFNFGVARTFRALCWLVWFIIISNCIYIFRLPSRYKTLYALLKNHI